MKISARRARVINGKWGLFLIAVASGCGGQVSETSTENGGAYTNEGTAPSGGHSPTAESSLGGGTSTLGADGVTGVGDTLATTTGMAGSMINGGGHTAAGGVMSTGGATQAGDYCNGIFKDRYCGSTGVQVDVQEANMLIVLDESGSMNDVTTPGGLSKWSIAYQALSTTLTQVEDQINFGLELFPYLEGGIPIDSASVSEVCAMPGDAGAAINVPIGLGPTTVQQILQKVSTQTPAGGTPTAEALNRAYDYYALGDGRTLAGSRWVLLVTDGGPNCNEALACDFSTCTQNIDSKCAGSANCCSDAYGYLCVDDIATTLAITKLAALGVNTFVVGLPGSEAFASLFNTFANTGRMPNPSSTDGNDYYAVSAATAQTDLTKALGDITSKIAGSCDIVLASTPTVAQDKLIVAIDCNLIQSLPSGVNPDAGNVDGFYIDYTQTPAHLNLVGAPCRQLKVEGIHHVDFVPGCGPIN